MSAKPIRPAVILLFFSILLHFPRSATSEDRESTIAGLKTYHLGNSLMDTVVNLLEPAARSAGHDHQLFRCTIPGAPTEFIWKKKKGFGESDVSRTFRDKAPFDHIITQPFAGHERSIENEADHSGKFFALCREHSPNVQFWLYQQWPNTKLSDAWSKGTISLGKTDLARWKKLPLKKGESVVDSKGWRGIVLRRKPARNWAEAINNHARYFEVLRSEMRKQFPDQPLWIIPGGQALAALKKKIEAGEMPGVKRFGAAFSDGLHMSELGKYLITLVFYACLYQENPVGRVSTAGTKLSKEQARVLQWIAWETAIRCPYSGVNDKEKSPPQGNTSDWFPFRAENDNGPSVIGMEDWIETPAGKHGGVRSVGDHFEFTDGTRVKFWGVNNGNSNYLDSRRPRGREQLREFARHYRKYGVNCARLHKFAENAGGLLGNSVLEFVPEKLNAFDYYLHQLKLNGIYFGFSHVFYLKLQPGDRDRVLAFDEVGTTTGLKFARDIQNLHIEQTVRLLKHKNPYTGLTYAEDPALAFVEMHNEDNLYWPNVQAKINSAPAYKKLICRMFSEWLEKKYGDHEGLVKAWGPDAMDINKHQRGEHLDKQNIYPVANCFSLLWWLEKQPQNRQRALDTAWFLYEVQVNFYRRYEKAIRDAGYQGPLIGSCWQAGYGVPHYYNLHSDYLVGIIDRHNYWGGKRTAGKSMLAKPGIGLFSVGLQQVIDRPFAFSEWISVFPNEWAAEGPAIIGAYGMGLQGWDASYEFYSGHGSFSKSLGRTWNVQQPSQIGMYPAIARMVYRGDVREGPVVSVRNVHLPSFAQSDDLGFEEKTIQDGDFKEFTGGFQPGLAVGRMVVAFKDQETETHPLDLAKYKKGSTITSVTGELAWTVSANQKGYFTINTAGTKAVVGFAPQKPFSLGLVTIEPHSPFSLIFVTSLEKERGIAQSGRLLISVMARSKNTGMEYNVDRTKVINKGKAPVLLEPVRARIRIARAGYPTVNILDHDGRRTGKTRPVDGGIIDLDGSRDKALYYEVVYRKQK